MAEEETKELTEEETQEEQTSSEETPETEEKEETTTEETEEEPEEKEEPESQEETKEEPEEEKDLSKVTEADEAKDVLKSKGFDYAELAKEFDEKGEISKETRAKLAEVGITDELIDGYIEGQKAKVQKEFDELSVCIGGRESFDTVIKWAAENLPQEEIQSINAVRDKNVLKIILKDLKSRMEDKEGITPEYTKGEGGKPAQDIYRSQAEMFEDIMNPKYKKDEAYRKDVQKKIAASREAGVDLGI